jgi:uncharacterized protein (TIGR03546 family)
MYFIVKLLKKFFKIFNSAAAPWQIALGAFFGLLIGFLPLFPLSHGPAPLGWVVLLAALIINCHLTAVIAFWALGKVLALSLAGPATLLGNHCENLARACADNPFLHASLMSHTGYLGLALIAAILAPVFAILMGLCAHWFRVHLRERLLARKQLVTVGKVGGNLILVRIACWFFDL